MQSRASKAQPTISIRPPSPFALSRHSWPLRSSPAHTSPYKYTIGRPFYRRAPHPTRQPSSIHPSLTMSFRLLFLATLLMLGVASVCAVSQYSIRVNQGTLIYKAKSKDGKDTSKDEVCFEPKYSWLASQGWTLSVWWDKGSDTGTIIGHGKGCNGSTHSGFYKVITDYAKNKGHVYFTFGYQHSQATEGHWVKSN
ncbi:hypothetical protein ACQY0O_006584 [Thecaphora frezii]